MAATESSFSPVVESVVPACMFAPDAGCAEDPTGDEHSDAGDEQNGDAGDQLDLSSKVHFRPDGLFLHKLIYNRQCNCLFHKCMLFKDCKQLQTSIESCCVDDTLPVRRCQVA